jgi:hypothetical protein
MERADPILFPRASGPTDEQLDTTIAEIDGAIELVSRGAAVRIRLVGFALAEAVAGLAAAHAQVAGVAFQLDRADVAGAFSLIVGPIV